MTLSAHEFIGRFIQHILPERFVRLRSYGILSARNRPTKASVDADDGPSPVLRQTRPTEKSRFSGGGSLHLGESKGAAGAALMASGACGGEVHIALYTRGAPGFVRRVSNKPPRNHTGGRPRPSLPRKAKGPRKSPSSIGETTLSRLLDKRANSISNEINLTAKSKAGPAMFTPCIRSLQV